MTALFSLPTLATKAPEGYTLRALSSDDYSRGHFDLLSVLTAAPDVGASAWAGQFSALQAKQDVYYPLVIVDNATDKLVGNGMVVVEQKFIRGLGKVGHIEDIAVAEETQGQGLGKVMILALTELSEHLGCYKTILDCDPKNEGFYVKCGYENKGVEMAKYAAK